MAWDSQVTYLRLLFRAKKALDTGETHLNFIDKTPFLCIKEGIGIYRLIDFFRVIVMVKLLSTSRR
jgi:hypothetical protein